jgi:hypothetical protein
LRHIEEFKVKTRKGHRCVGCGRRLPSGTEMKINKYVMEDEIRNDYWCKTCQKYADKYMQGEYEFLPGEFKSGEGWEKIRKEVEGDK